MIFQKTRELTFKHHFIIVFFFLHRKHIFYGDPKKHGIKRIHFCFSLSPPQPDPIPSLLTYRRSFIFTGLERSRIVGHDVPPSLDRWHLLE